MYENVRKPKLKSNRVLWILVIAVALVFAVVIATVLWPFDYLDSFQNFVGDLSNSTVSSYNSPTGLWASTGEGDVRIIGENIHLVYFILANAGVGQVCSVPDRPPEAVLRYADGAVLELWNVPAQNPDSNRTQCLCVSYVNPRGERYTYNHDHLDLSRLPLSVQQNLPNKMKDRLEQEKQDG